MSKRTAYVFTAFALVLMIGSAVLSVGIWQECRAAGHSFFYCVRLVSR